MPAAIRIRLICSNRPRSRSGRAWLVITVLKVGVSNDSSVESSITPTPSRNPPLSTPRQVPVSSPVMPIPKIQRAAPTSRPMASRKPITTPSSSPPITKRVVWRGLP